MREYMLTGSNTDTSKFKALVLFDWEKTLLAGESLDCVGDFLGIREKIEGVTRLGMEGKIRFKQSLERRIGLINMQLAKGAKLEDIIKAVEKIPLDENAVYVTKRLGELGYAVGIVSGGLDIFVNPSAAKLHPDFLFASRTGIDSNTITVNALDDKGKVVSFLRRNYGFNRIYAVGDGANDIQMMTETGLGIGYKPKKILIPYCKYIINDLTQLIQIIKEEENA